MTTQCGITLHPGTQPKGMRCTFPVGHSGGCSFNEADARNHWHVECVMCGQSYDEVITRPQRLHPTICGACGSSHIRVTEHRIVTDRRSVRNYDAERFA